MYLSHYGFNEKPFTSGPDPRYLWFGDRQLGLYTSLEAAVLRGSNIILLTGDVGTGKTTFIKSLEAGLREKTVFANILDPALKELDFYNMIAHGLGMDRNFNSRSEFIRHMKAIARETAKLRKRVVIAVDESQCIEFGILKKIWFFANAEPDMASSVTWIFVGQGEFLEHFKDDAVELLRANNVDHFRTHQLDKAETDAYIRFRLKRAGAEQSIFSGDAIDRIFCHTAGHPRVINNICDLALLHGYAEGTRKIDSKIIDECAGKVCLPHQLNEKEVPKKTSLKAAAYLLTSLLCLTMFGVLTYRINQSDKLIAWEKRGRPKRASVQLSMSEDVQASLSNVDLQTTTSSRIFKIYQVPGMPSEGMHQKPPSDGASLLGGISRFNGIVSKNHARYSTSSDTSGKIERTDPKQMSAPQEADARTGSDTSFNKLASKAELLPGTALSPPARVGRERMIGSEKLSMIPEEARHEKEPDPSAIIDWLIEN